MKKIFCICLLVLIGIFPTKVVASEVNAGTLPYCDDMIIPEGARDTISYPNPTFNHVNQVNIIVDTEENLPDPLKQENLESILKNMYVERFKPINWCDECQKNECYNRINPNINIVHFKTAQEKDNAKKESYNDAVLTVYASIQKTSESSALVKIINYRPNAHISFWRSWLNFPQDFWNVPSNKSTSFEFIVDLEKSNEEIEKYVESSFSNRIK